MYLHSILNAALWLAVLLTIYSVIDFLKLFSPIITTFLIELLATATILLSITERKNCFCDR